MFNSRNGCGTSTCKISSESRGLANFKIRESCTTFTLLGRVIQLKCDRKHAGDFSGLVQSISDCLQHAREATSFARRSTDTIGARRFHWRYPTSVYGAKQHNRPSCPFRFSTKNLNRMRSRLRYGHE
jgi:hypothetical protein